eukprot:10536837-Prorocentrum_lima.AAC.1
MGDALTLVLRYFEGMQQASEYFGLLNKNGAWLLSESARRTLQLDYCLPDINTSIALCCAKITPSCS